MYYSDYLFQFLALYGVSDDGKVIYFISNFIYDYIDAILRKHGNICVRVCMYVLQLY